MEVLREMIFWNTPVILIVLFCYWRVTKMMQKPTELPKHVWTFVYPNDKKSPRIMGLSNDTHLIFYPKFSTPYLHQLDEKAKFISVLEGTIYDKVSKTVLKKGDKLKISPHDQYIPYTKDNECYIRVHIGSIEKELVDACGY